MDEQRQFLYRVKKKRFSIRFLMEIEDKKKEGGNYKGFHRGILKTGLLHKECKVYRRILSTGTKERTKKVQNRIVDLGIGIHIQTGDNMKFPIAGVDTLVCERGGGVRVQNISSARNGVSLSSSSPCYKQSLQPGGSYSQIIDKILDPPSVTRCNVNILCTKHRICSHDDFINLLTDS